MFFVAMLVTVNTRKSSSQIGPTGCVWGTLPEGFEGGPPCRSGRQSRNAAYLDHAPSISTRAKLSRRGWTHGTLERSSSAATVRESAALDNDQAQLDETTATEITPHQRMQLEIAGNFAEIRNEKHQEAVNQLAGHWRAGNSPPQQQSS